MKEIEKYSTVEIKENKQGLRTLVDLATIGTVLLLISSWVFSLNGRSYHDGYLSYLNQESTMYPITSLDAGFYGTIAWFKITLGALDNISKGSIKAFFAIFLLILFAVTIYTFLNHYLSDKKNSSRLEKKSFLQRFPLIRASLLNSFSIFLIVYAALGLLVFTVGIIMVMINPFRDIGRNAALKDITEGYRNAPWIMLKGPSSISPERWKIVECSTQFCIIFKDKEIVSVPVGKIEWVETLPPGAKKEKS